MKIKLILLFLAIISLLSFSMFSTYMAIGSKDSENNFKIKEFSSKMNSFYNKFNFTEPVNVIVNVNQGSNERPGSTSKITGKNQFKVDLNYDYFNNNINSQNLIFIKKVLSHELMHIITNQDNQISEFNDSNFDTSNQNLFDKKEKECQENYFNSEGCFNSNSYLSKFKKQFWTQNMIDEFNFIQKIDNKLEFNKQLREWGRLNSPKFLSDLSFTGIEEDIAE